MNLTKLSAVTEIVSSIAIVITLIYLTVQTQQNTEALHANSRQATIAADIEFLTTLMDNPEIEVNVYLPGFNITNEFSMRRLGRPI